MKKAPKNSSSSQKDSFVGRHPKSFPIAVAICVVLVLIWPLISVQLNIAFFMKPKMEQYIENKYKTEFVLGPVSYQGGGLGVKGDYVANAYQADDPKTIFSIFNGDGDNYLEIYWLRQEQKRLEPIVKQIFGNEAQLEVRLGFTDQDLRKQVYYDRNYTHPLPSFESVRGEFGERILVDLTIYQASDPSTKPPLEPLAERTWKFVQQEVHPYEGQISFSVLDRYISLGKKYRCSTYNDFGKPTVLTSIEQVKRCYIYKDNNR